LIVKRRIVILTGVSASWKSSVQEEILDNPNWVKPINFTTRKPRSDYELNEYVFLSKKQFEIKKNNWDFLETTDYWGNNYWITKYLPEDKNIILVLDPIGRTQVIRDFIYSWVKYESIYLQIDKKTQKERLLNRGDSVYEIEKREKDFLWFWPTESDLIIDWNKNIEDISNYILTLIK
jgi:guanylate kinase